MEALLISFFLLMIIGAPVGVALGAGRPRWRLLAPQRLGADGRALNLDVLPC